MGSSYSTFPRHSSPAKKSTVTKHSQKHVLRQNPSFAMNDFLFLGEIILGLSSKDVFRDGTGRWTARNGVKVYIKEYGAISLATSFALEKYYSKATEDEKLKMWWVNIKRFRIETDGGSLSGVSSISSQPVSEGTVQGNGGSQSRWAVDKCQGCIFVYTM